jgi:hypothetical protein
VIAAYLRRGLAAGLLAGLLAGAFAFAFGEPLQDRAVALEAKADAAHAHGAAPGHHGGGMVELSRSTQKVGVGSTGRCNTIGFGCCPNWRFMSGETGSSWRVVGSG